MVDERTGDDDRRSLVASGGWTAPIVLGADWLAGLEEQEDGTFVALHEQIPVVSTPRGGLRFGQPPPPGWVPPEPPVVHRVFLTATAFDADDGTATVRLQCSCGETLWDQGDEPGPVSLGELERIAARHEDPDADEEW
jgi:hypothetical protein